MTTVTIPFDGQPLGVDIPEANLAQVIAPHASVPLADLQAAIAAALADPIGQPPLEQWVRPGDRVLLVSDDNTRLTPVDRMIPPLLDRLNAAGVPDGRIGCILALGTHRYMSEPEIDAKVGAAVRRRIRVFNHEWREPDNLVDLGRSAAGTPLMVNRAVVAADVVIGLGAIVPHHIPGFSGSSKIIQPGVCGPQTTAETHMLSCEGGGDSLLGIEENPVRRDMDDMADRVGMRTIFNVVMDSQGRVTDLFFGEMRAAFAAGVRAARRIYGVAYREQPDIVIANSAPCDLDFWQSHKAQYPAQRMVKPGGTIIVCTPAPEGVSPVHTDLLDYTAWPSRRIRAAYREGRIKNGVAAALAVAWALVREKASVITFSPGIPAEHKVKLGHTHAPSLQWALAEALRRRGPGARVAVLTHAPDLLPIRGSTSE
ncbi:MAG: nickel-dependent lactate racemase [Desulfobacterales bacterium]|jgi:nickel-dependent lactate racemase|nr:nickel-dependent lactate racemase [Desulfobacterales bacterium]